MAISAERERGPPTESWRSLELKAAATMDCDAVLAELGSTPQGLSTDQASRRLADVGPNALRSHGARPLAVLARQFKNPLLILLVGTALVEGQPLTRRHPKRRIDHRASRWSIPGRVRTRAVH
jgi:hypothetical protein